MSRAMRNTCGLLRVHVGVRRNEKGLAGDAGPRIERLLEDRVAEDRDAHRAQNAPAMLPEQLLPAKAAQHVEQLGVRTGDDGSALAEQRQQVAPAAATALLVRDA